MSFLHMEIDPSGKVTSESFSPDVIIDRENITPRDDIIKGTTLQDSILVSLNSGNLSFISLPSYFPNEIFYVIHGGYVYLLTSSSSVRPFPASQSITRPQAIS